jgi:hypothetical protein
MARRSIRRPELAIHQRRLALAIDRALNDGQRGDGQPQQTWTSWTNLGFAEIAGVAEGSIANWRDPDKLMPPVDIQPLLKAFFGKIDKFKGDCASMRRLWQLARGYIVDDEAVPKNLGITRSSKLQGEIELVTLQTHVPDAKNDGSMNLSITLIISPDRELQYGGKAITVGLKEALLVVDPGCYQPAFGSRPSQRQLPNFKASAAGERITGPVDPETGMIDGEPLGDSHFLTLEPVDNAVGPVAIGVHASRESFCVVRRNVSNKRADVSCSPNQTAIINALFSDQLRNQDDRHRAILARAELTPRAPQCL